MGPEPNSASTCVKGAQCLAKRETLAEGREWQVKVEAELKVAVNLNFRKGRVAGVGCLLVLRQKTSAPGSVAAAAIAIISTEKDR